MHTPNSDFQLQLESSGRGGAPVSAGAYLEEVLGELRGGGGTDEANRNQVRPAVKCKACPGVATRAHSKPCMQLAEVSK